jgi:hypothetical protein
VDVDRRNMLALKILAGLAGASAVAWLLAVVGLIPFGVPVVLVLATVAVFFGGLLLTYTGILS